MPLYAYGGLTFSTAKPAQFCTLSSSIHLAVTFHGKDRGYYHASISAPTFVRILWVKPGKLLPLDSGGKLRTYNILRHLSTIEQVTFLSYYGGTHDPDYEREILNYIPGTIPFHTAAPETKGPARFLDYLRRFSSPVPYSVDRFTVSRVQKVVTEWMARDRFDIAICDFLASSLNFPQELPIPAVLFQHNVESVLWSRRAQFETKWLDRRIANIEFTKMARFEPEQVRRFHHVLAVSDEDRDVMREMTDPSCITVIPTGVDLELYRNNLRSRPVKPLVVFTGSMDWAPNIDGVEYFCRDIWPQVLAKVPTAHFRIVGRNPSARVHRLASTFVEVTGSVPSILDHLREAAVVVVPLRIGGGTRIKIYEGMAMGKAIVSTRIGAEGLDVSNGHDILLADNRRQFADHVVRMLCDEESRRRIEAAAAATAQKHDWSAVVHQLVEVLAKTIRFVRPRSTGREPVAVLESCVH